MSNSATKPSVGRILHYVPGRDDSSLNYELGQPMAAQIVYVCGPDRVNIVGHDHHGQRFTRINVPIVNDTGDSNVNVVRGYCVWMPYQKAVAAGAEKPNEHA